MIVARSVRGPASYATGGFLVRIGEVQKIRVSSGNMAGVMITSSSTFSAKGTNVSGNVVSVLVQTASGTEIANATDLSAMHFMLIVDGY